MLPSTGLHKTILKQTNILSTVKASVKKITTVKPASVVTKTSTAAAVVKSLTKEVGKTKSSSHSSGHTVTHKVSTIRKDAGLPTTSPDDLAAAPTDPAFLAATEQQTAAAGPAATATNGLEDMDAGSIATDGALIETTFVTQDPLSTGDPTAAPSDVPGNATASVGAPAEPTTTTVTADAGADKIFGKQGAVVGVLGGVMAVGAWLI